MEHNKIQLKPRTVVELPSKLNRAIRARILVANELKDMEFTIRQVESVDGSRPRMLIRISHRILRRSKKHTTT
jgi:hypothetical protein